MFTNQPLVNARVPFLLSTFRFLVFYVVFFSTVHMVWANRFKYLI